MKCVSFEDYFRSDLKLPHWRFLLSIPCSNSWLDHVSFLSRYGPESGPQAPVAPASYQAPVAPAPPNGPPPRHFMYNNNTPGGPGGPLPGPPMNFAGNQVHVYVSIWWLPAQYL